jgi:serine/threonine-protein kinase OSR1/STK39
MESTYST